MKTSLTSSPTPELLAAHPLIIAANRGPVEFARGDNGTVHAPSRKRGRSHGDACPRAVRRSALGRERYFRCRPRASRARGGEPIIVDDADGPRLRLFFAAVPHETYDLAYNDISNELLWFLQHYLWDAAHEPDIDDATWRAWELGYQITNLAFANTIARAAASAHTTQPVVMLQDYHLYLTAALVRERLPGAILQQFIHIPWPDKDYWRLLPLRMRRGNLRQPDGKRCGGLPNPRPLPQLHRHLRRQRARSGGRSGAHDLRYRGRTIRVRPYPISLDVPDVRRVAAGEDSDAVPRIAARLLSANAPSCG